MILASDTGWVSVGIDHDTATFAVQIIRIWWHADTALYELSGIRHRSQDVPRRRMRRYQTAGLRSAAHSAMLPGERSGHLSSAKDAIPLARFRVTDVVIR